MTEGNLKRANWLIGEKHYLERAKDDLSKSNNFNAIIDILDRAELNIELPDIEKLKNNAIKEIDKKIAEFENEFKEL